MPSSIAIVDYEAGNLTSVFNALKFLGIDALVTKDPAQVAQADRVIFPGVGAARSAMETLHRTGLGKAVQDSVRAGKPVLGICIGCQIILESSEENGGVPGLALLPGKAVRFRDEEYLKIPHMGWNQVEYTPKVHPLFQGVPNQSDFYFVHSFHPLMQSESNVCAWSTYGSQRFASAIYQDNLVATQFHLEKSGEVGLVVLRNFSQWEGKSC